MIAAHWRDWSSRAVFRVRDDGIVVLARDRSTGGDYEGREPMGLFWSLTGPRHSGAGGVLPPVQLERVAATIRSRRRAFAGGRRRPASASRRQRSYATALSAATTSRSARTGFRSSSSAAPAAASQRSSPRCWPRTGSQRSRSRTSPSRGCRRASSGSRSSTLSARSAGLPSGGESTPRASSCTASHAGRSRRCCSRVHFPRLVHGVVALVPTSVVVPGLTTEPGGTRRGCCNGAAIRTRDAHSRRADPRSDLPRPAASRIPCGCCTCPSRRCCGALWPRPPGRDGAPVRDVGHSLGFAVPNLPLLNVVDTLDRHA